MAADFSDFDRYCDRHDIKPGEEPAAFAAWLNERTGWDGPMGQVGDDLRKCETCGWCGPFEYLALHICKAGSEQAPNEERFEP